MNFIIPTILISAIVATVIVMHHIMRRPDVDEKYILVWVKYTYKGCELYHKMPKCPTWEARSYLANLHQCRFYEIDIVNL